jgi:hypothetical protein
LLIRPVVAQQSLKPVDTIEDALLADADLRAQLAKEQAQIATGLENA